MTRTELLDLIANGENSGVEFKRDTLENRALAKELVAFANFQGGLVLLGVEDDGSLTGLSRPQLEEWVMNACRDKVRPELIPYFEIVRNVQPGKDVAVVRIEPGWTVHHLWHDHRRIYYIRVGTQSREASPEELERLFQRRGALRMETRPVSGTRFESLDVRRLMDYFGRVRGQEVPAADDVAGWTSLLVNTEFMIETDGAPAVTVAGLLLLAPQPNRYLPQAGIDAVAYPGTEKDYETIERVTLRGPMTPLFGDGGLVDNGLVEQAIAFIRRNTRGTGSLEDGARRIERPTYPEEAVREALVNALVHRDYLLSGSDIELSLYADRLELTSPGRLPNGITPQRMVTGCRAARNQLLKDTMRDYGYLEHMGMGVPRKIVKGMRIHNGTHPEFLEQDETFTVRLWA